MESTSFDPSGIHLSMNKTMKKRGLIGSRAWLDSKIVRLPDFE
jgi:hypothetical protein